MHGVHNRNQDTVRQVTQIKNVVYPVGKSEEHLPVIICLTVKEFIYPFLNKVSQRGKKQRHQDREHGRQRHAAAGRAVVKECLQYKKKKKIERREEDGQRRIDQTSPDNALQIEKLVLVNGIGDNQDICQAADMVQRQAVKSRNQVAIAKEHQYAPAGQNIAAPVALDHVG